MSIRLFGVAARDSATGLFRDGPAATALCFCGGLESEDSLRRFSSQVEGPAQFSPLCLNLRQVEAAARSTLPSAPFSRPTRFPRPHDRCGPSIYITWPTVKRDGDPVDGRIPHERRRRIFDCSGGCHAAVRRRLDEEVPPELTLRSIVPGGVSVGSPRSRAVLAGA